MHSFRAIVFVSSLAILVTSVACDLGPVALGGDDTDAFKIADTAALAHIASALDGGGELTMQNLIERGDGLTFTGTPNPSTFLQSMNTVDDARNRQGRAPVSVLTYNVALLDVEIFGVIPYAESPDLDARRGSLPGIIFDSGADIIMCQEVWLDRDVEHFSRQAVVRGYRPFVHDRRGHNDGLITFVREAIIAGGSQTELDFSSYGSQVGTEYFPGPGIARGWMSVRFVHAGAGHITAFNTHMQAYPENWLGRLKQARELGIVARQHEEGTGDVVFVAGDLNSGPYYRVAEWTLPDGSVADRWLHNAIAYPALLTYGGLIDAAIMGRSAGDAIADVTLGDTVINDAATALEIPGAQAGWCDRTPATTFTATDCNSLYFDQYAGTEYPARLDHIFVSEGERVIVTNSRVVFTDTRSFGGVVREPSDHYGVRIDVLITPR